MPTSILISFLLLTFLLTMSAAAQDAAIGGAGVGIKQADDGRVIIERVAPDGPAAKAGIQPGDVLVGVDKLRVADLNGSQLVDAIRGPIGSKVVLVYFRGDAAEPTYATVIRASLGPAAAVAPPVPDVPRQPDRPAAAPVAPQGAMKFRAQTIKDPAAQNCDAVTFLVPDGWQAQGEIAWLHNFSVLANLRLRIADPASGTTLDWLPTMHFSWTDQLQGLMQPGMNWQGALTIPPIADPSQFVQTFYAPQALSHLRGLQPIAREDFPKLAQAAVAGSPGWQAQAVRLRYAFEVQGKPWEQDVCFTLAYAPAASGVAQWNVQNAMSATAPRGELDKRSAVIKATVANVQYTPQWLATLSVVKQLFRQGLQQQMADTAAFGQRLQEYNAHIQQLSQQIHDERMKSMDRIAESQREYLGGVETVVDPYQRLSLYIPAGYKEQWVNQRGEIILTDQVGYNPNIGDTNEWRHLERLDPMRR